MNNNNCGRNEVTIILEKIIAMQKRAVHEELAEEFCDVSFLGRGDCKILGCNTRPVMLFCECCDKTWSCPISHEASACDNEELKSCVFRAERIQNGAITLRALEVFSFEDENADNCMKKKFKSTNSFITIKLDKITALRCLDDTFVDLCIR